MIEMVEPVTDAGAGGAGRPRARARGVLRTASSTGSRSRTSRRSPRRWTRRSRCPASARCPSTSPTAARSARSSTPPRSGFAIVPDEARELAELGERIRPHVNEQVEVAHPLEPGALAPLLRRLRRAAARRRRRAPRDDRLPRPARPRPHGHGDERPVAVLDARGEMGDEYIAESVIDTRFIGRVVAHHARRATSTRSCPSITGRAWITGFHQVVVDPTDPLGATASSSRTPGAPATWTACSTSNRVVH